MYGIRLVHHELSLENWAQGRYCEALRLAHAQRLRAAYRDASFETRFDVEGVSQDARRFPFEASVD